MTQYHPPSTKAQLILPPNFARNFIRGGWRTVERMHTPRTDKLLKLKELAGGVRLDHARRDYLSGKMTLDAALATVSQACAAE